MSITSTLTVMTALDSAEILVMVQVIFWPSTISSIKSAPSMPTVSMNFKPSGKLSITVKTLV
jgi:hypothetical protein